MCDEPFPIGCGATYCAGCFGAKGDSTDSRPLCGRLSSGGFSPSSAGVDCRDSGADRASRAAARAAPAPLRRRLRFLPVWIARWRRAPATRVDYAPSQEAGARAFRRSRPRRSRARFSSSFRRARFRGRARPSSRALAAAPGAGALLSAYRRVPGFAPAAELAYRLDRAPPAGAAARDAAPLGAVRRAAHIRRGERAVPAARSDSATSRRSSRCGPRWPVSSARAGSCPSAVPLGWVRSQTGRERSGSLPTLCWLSSSDAFLHALCAAGTLRARSSRAWGSVPPRARSSLGFSTFRSRSRARSSSSSSGTPAARDGPARDLPRAAAALAPRRARLAAFAARSLPPALAALPADVLVGLGQARERRPDVAQPHRAALPLRDAASAAVDGVVRAPAFRPGSRRSRALVLFAIELAVPFLFFAPRRLRLVAFGATRSAAARSSPRPATTRSSIC